MIVAILFAKGKCEREAPPNDSSASILGVLDDRIWYFLLILSLVYICSIVHKKLHRVRYYGVATFTTDEILGWLRGFRA